MKQIFFWNSLAFPMIQQVLAIWSLVPLLFINSAWTSGSSRFMYSWSLAWRVLSIILLSCKMIALVQYFEHSLAVPFFGIGMKIDLFQSYGHCWVFQIYWHIECSTLTASSLAQLEFHLLTLLKVCQGWNGAFSLPWNPLEIRGLSWSPLILLSFPIWAMMVKWPPENPNFRGKEWVFKIAFWFYLFYLYHISLVNCIQHFEMKCDNKGTHTLSHVGVQTAGHLACVFIK